MKKVLILIPTYNRPKYFSIALESVLKQTYKNIQIVVSDNSTNDETEQIIYEQMKTHSNIKYYHHKNFDANDNWNFLRKYQQEDSECEYVNWLMDDDIFYPQKIEIMTNLLDSNEGVAFVTSARNEIDANGEVKRTHSLSYNRATRLNGQLVGKDALFNMTNRIGEPTTCLINKKYLRNGDLCWNEDETGFFSMIDLSTWLQLLSQGDMIYFPQALSALRVHEGMASVQNKTYVTFWNDWAKLVWSGIHKQIFLKTKEEVRAAVLLWLHHAAKGLRNAYLMNYEGAELTKLERLMKETFKAINNDYKMDFEIKSEGLNKLR